MTSKFVWLHTQLFTVLAVFLLLPACQNPGMVRAKIKRNYTEKHLDFSIHPEGEKCCVAEGKKIAIASGGIYASKIGMQIHRAGGNISDVAVAVAFALAVERPASAGIGGGGFLTAHFQKPTASDFFVDFRETAPKKASRNMYLDKSGNVIPRLSLDGALAVGTPGFVAGLHAFHRKSGKMPWAKVLAPAAKLAREGFPISHALAIRVAHRKAYLMSHRYTRKLWFPDGKHPIAAGQKLVQKDLAKTIDKIAKQGPAVFYRGEIAKKIVRFVKRKGGILSLNDLKNYRVKLRKPIRGKFRQYNFLSAPPPSSGGLLIAQMLNVLETMDLEKWASDPAKYTHLLAEVMSHAYADRSQHIGDPDFVKTPHADLADKDYAAKIRAKLNLNVHTPSKDIKPGNPEYRGADTTHFSIIDNVGNAISCTISINTAFGSGLSVPGVGVFLNNEMDDFSSKPGVANAYGLVGNDANAIAPNKRMLSSMSPTIVLENGRPILAVGGAGGSTIISGTLQVILNYLTLFPGDLKKAMFAPRMHFQWLPDVLFYEKKATPRSLEDSWVSLGYEIRNFKIRPRINAVAFDLKSGTLTSVSEPRSSSGVGTE